MALNKKRVVFAASLVSLLLFLLIFRLASPQESKELVEEAPPVPEPTLKYGIVVDSLLVIENKIGKNQFLADILLPYEISYQEIDRLAKKAKDVFDVRKLRTKKKYTILASQDSLAKARYFIYDPSPYFYVVYDLQDTMNIYKVERPIETRRMTGSGIIHTSLWETIVKNELPIEVAVKMEDIFGWSIDFHQVRKGDKFKLIYDEQFIEGQSVGVEGVSGAEFIHNSVDYQGYYFEVEDVDSHGYYFDEEARPMKKVFLKSPVRYSRISSGFNRARFHPVLKRVKPHLGTDYAAPIGTPIYAVASGTVTKVAFTRGNGKFVKIKHDRKYSTQYLHMNGFAKGIRSGVHVKQGDVIGYVGKTGLATGPHVCFRFWKNGKQVNHRKLKLPPPKPMPKKYIPAFESLRDSMQLKLDEIPFLQDQEDELPVKFTEDTNSKVQSDSLKS